MLEKVLKRVKRQVRVRSQITGTSTRPRLSVFRSNSSISVQAIDDTTGNTIEASSDLKLSKTGTKVDMAKMVGEDIAKKLLAKSITSVVFDRGGFRYHGRVKALADAARNGGLKF
ncbi:MAG: 50S ribosomal protein L18 [Candidatus Gracilibacteria bacterium]|nr:50S ribosomal protein L18 [Candidatus Gracilibacteria bacterium]